MNFCTKCGGRLNTGAAACPSCGATPENPSAGPPSAGQYAQPVGARRTSGFLSSLFDISFTDFVTTRLIKALFVLGMLVATLWALALVGGGLLYRGVGLMLVPLAPLVFFACVISMRVSLELVIVVFRVAEHLAEMARQERRTI
jgi:hypothetical protein